MEERHEKALIRKKAFVENVLKKVKQSYDMDFILCKSLVLSVNISPNILKFYF